MYITQIMTRIKYIFSVYYILFIFNLVDSRSQPICRAVSKKPFWKQAFSIGCSNPNDNWWECISELTYRKPTQPSFWEKCKSATQCFTWEVFEESQDSDDNLVTIPFENVINGFEFIIQDFIQFYIDYVTNVLLTLWKLKLFGLIVNPATIFAVGMYIFHKKMLMPLFRDLQNAFETEDEDSEFCATCDVVKSSQALAEPESEGIDLEIE